MASDSLELSGSAKRLGVDRHVPHRIDGVRRGFDGGIRAPVARL